MDAIEYEFWKQRREEEKAEKQDAREAAKEKLKRHVMGWVVPCGSHFFGPPPSGEGDLYYLRKTTGIKAIVSLKPRTGRTTKKSGYDTSVWYREMLKAKDDTKDDKLKVFIVPFDTKELPSMSDAEVVEAYVKTAKRVHKEYRTQGPLYFHHTDGFTHEGYVAMALWRLQSGRGDKVPSDPVAWLKEQGQDQVFKMTAEKELMQEIWARVKTISTGIGAMFVAQRARQQEEKKKKRKKDDNDKEEEDGAQESNAKKRKEPN